VNPQAWAGSPRLSRDGHVALTIPFPEAPDRRSALMAQHRSLTARKHCGHLGAVPRSHRPYLIDAVIQPHEPTPRHAARDRAPTNPGIEELSSRNEPMLPGGDRQDRPVPGVHFVNRGAIQRRRLTLSTYTVHFVNAAAGGGC
jgi:hypothetical protein